MKNFRCRRCGACCKWPGYVRISPEELIDMASFLGISPELFADEYTILTSDRNGLSLKENSKKECIFYSDDPPRCLVNPVKPRQCRDFPVKWNFIGWDLECEGAALEK